MTEKQAKKYNLMLQALKDICYLFDKNWMTTTDITSRFRAVRDITLRVFAQMDALDL